MTTTRSLRPSARARAVLAALVAVPVAVLLGTAGPAAAHGGPGKIEVLSATPQPDGSTVDVKVRLTFAEDGDPVDAATVTVTGELDGAGGSSPAFTPVTLTTGTEAGIFTGRVALPSTGSWTLRVTSVEPPASVTTPVASAAPAGGGSSTTAAPAPSTTAAGATAAPTTTVAPSTGDEPESGGNLLVSGVVAAVVGAVVASGVAVARSRRKPSGTSAE